MNANEIRRHFPEATPEQAQFVADEIEVTELANLADIGPLIKAAQVATIEALEMDSERRVIYIRRAISDAAQRIVQDA